MKLSYVLVGLVLIALLAAVFASGFFVGSTYAPYLATTAYAPNMMARGFAVPNGAMPGYRPGTGMMGGLGRGFGTSRVNRGFSMLGGFFPGFRFLIPLAFLALIVLVVILLMRRPRPVVVAPAAPANPPAAPNPPAETNQV